MAIYKYQYSTQAEREAVFLENATRDFIGESNVNEGNFLLFSDRRPFDLEADTAILKAVVRQFIIEINLGRQAINAIHPAANLPLVTGDGFRDAVKTYLGR